MFAPLLSEADPKQSQEGSIDPLGTYPIADALAVRLAPGVRERQSRPRFLTAMAVSFAARCAYEAVLSESIGTQRVRGISISTQAAGEVRNGEIGSYG
jgi:hypothetical protein